MKRVTKKVKQKKNPNKIQVTFTPEQREIVNSLRGDLGSTEAEIIRILVLAHPLIVDKIKRKQEGKFS